VLELTESVLIKNADNTVRVLHGLKDIGVKLSLDDFGTGFSSMSYFRDLPMDELKIDRSFVKALEPGTRELAIVRSVINLGHNLDLNIVAEGVETEYQLQILANQGCDTAQGYLLSKPMPAVAVRAFIDQFGAQPVSSYFWAN
jgi:EAL domain-containing protein (putative c-di-GMP-specific phosphodiesterase class I)